MPYRRIHWTFVLSLVTSRLASIIDELEFGSNENLTPQLKQRPNAKNKRESIDVRRTVKVLLLIFFERWTCEVRRQFLANVFVMQIFHVPWRREKKV